MILVDIEMPKDCIYCPMAHWNAQDNFTGCEVVGGKKYAMMTDEKYPKLDGRPSWCPIKCEIEIKEG